MVEDLDIHRIAIALGDASSFATWMAQAEPVLRSSLKRFAAAVDTEAVLQEALLRVWQVAPRFEADGKPNGLLRLGLRIARNLAISETRRLKTTTLDPSMLEDVAEPELATPSDPLLRRAIQDCRDRLPDKPALALNARITSAGAEPDATLAERLGMRKNTFLQNFTRARKLLIECLKARGIEIEAELT